MILRRIISAALFVGLFAGLVLGLFQVLSVNPIIFEAETFEVEEAHDHASYDHDEEAWVPEEGIERTTYTIMANISAGIGFAAILLALMSQFQLQGMTRLNLLKGATWGLAGFLVFFVAPGIGLPPEIPGIEAKPVEHRQLWWMFTVLSVATGLMVICFSPMKLKGLGLLCLIMPYLVPVPHHDGAAFVHPDAESVATLTRLHHEFIVASGISNLAFWLVLGFVSAWILNAWVLKGVEDGESASV